MTFALPKTDQNIYSYLTKWGSHSLAYHSLQTELSHFVTDIGYIAYIDFQNETIVLGDPIAEESNYTIIIEQFLQFRSQCSFVQIGQTFSSRLKKFGFRTEYFGVESQIQLPFDTKGGTKKEIRILHNAAERNKLSVREICDRNQLYALNSSQDKYNIASKEYRFLSRPINYFDEKDVRIFGAFQGSKLVSYSLFDPMYTNGKIQGYAEVMSRQIISSPKGSRAYTLLKAMHQFTIEKKEFVNIGLLPFYSCPESLEALKCCDKGYISRIFFMLYKSSPMVSNFSGLSFHKSRYRGELIPKYFASNSSRPYKALLCIFKLTTQSWFPKPRF